MILLNNMESVADAAGVTGKFLLFLSIFQCSAGMASPSDVFCWFLLLFNPCLFVVQYKLLPFSVCTCPQFFVCLWRLCPSAFPPHNPLASITQGLPWDSLFSVIFWSLVLLSLPAAFLLPWALLPPCSAFPLIIHVACSLLISWNTGTSLTDGNKNIWKEEWEIRQGPLPVSFSTLPLAPAVPDKSIKIPWAALGFKLPQQEHSTVIPNSYRSFCVLRQEVLCVCIKTL